MDNELITLFSIAAPLSLAVSLLTYLVFAITISAHKSTRKAEDLLKDNAIFKKELIKEKKEVEKLKAIKKNLFEEVSNFKTFTAKLNSDISVRQEKIDELQSMIDELKAGVVRHKETADKTQEAQTLTSYRRPASKTSSHKKTRMIGEIFLERKFITPEILKQSLEYQKQYGGTITEYLILQGYIDDDQLAQCLSSQFGYPYLPLKSFEISQKAIDSVPFDIAKKYMLIPVDNHGDVITVVMVDPINISAIKDIEAITGCIVQPFVGKLSEIIDAIERNYKIKISIDKPSGKTSFISFFTDSAEQRVHERRRSARIESKIKVHFPLQNRYKKAITKNVSRYGFLFESDCALPVGSYIILEFSLQEEDNPIPVSAVIEVLRSSESSSGRYDIAVKIIKISDNDLQLIMQHAASLEASE
ncbi:MAG: PilZ domain-containing protein [Candidatus Omnitrophota bacterium]